MRSSDSARLGAGEGCLEGVGTAAQPVGGADRIAADTWRAWGYPVEGHPAERGPDGRVLGPERNARMVALGADLCLAFPLPASRGTRNCMALARAAGIPVYEYAPTATT